MLVETLGIVFGCVVIMALIANIAVDLQSNRQLRRERKIWRR